MTGEYGGVGGGGKNQSAGWSGGERPFTPRLRFPNANAQQAKREAKQARTDKNRAKAKKAKQARRRNRS